MLYWNTLMFELAKIAAGKLNPDALRQSILVNFVVGEGPKEKGYRFIPEAGLSVQGQDANQAWRASSHLLKLLHISMHVVMAWEANDKAAYPGQTGQMNYQAVRRLHADAQMSARRRPHRVAHAPCASNSAPAQRDRRPRHISAEGS
jgi:hypothetical protein